MQILSHHLMACPVVCPLTSCAAAAASCPGTVSGRWSNNHSCDLKGHSQLRLAKPYKRAHATFNRRACGILPLLLLPPALQGDPTSPALPALGSDVTEVQLSCPASSFYAEDFYFAATLVGAYNETTLGECELAGHSPRTGALPGQPAQPARCVAGTVRMIMREPWPCCHALPPAGCLMCSNTRYCEKWSYCPLDSASG